jgi:putative N6-adenine-specific DNA methylase
MFPDKINRKSSIVVTCLPHLAPFVNQEIEKLGYRNMSVQPTSVEIQGDLTDAVDLNLKLRTASKVLYRIRKMRCTSVDDLYSNITTIPWELYFTDDAYITVESNTDHPDIRNIMYLNQRVKDAVVDRFSRLFNRRPDSGSDKGGIVINVWWKGNELYVSLDTSGHTLAKHGYREYTTMAPLQECLAAALVMATEWDLKRPFVNPMCGSGTIAIEAALLAAGIYPNKDRDHFSFMNYKGFDIESFNDLRSSVGRLNVPGKLIYASDSDTVAVRSARKNAEIAGVADMIEFEVSDFRDCVFPDDSGVVFLNPPYDDRIEVTDISQLYSEIGDWFKKECTGTNAFLFTANLDAAKSVGLRTSSRTIFMNGPNEARLLQYNMYSGTKK